MRMNPKLKLSLHLFATFISAGFWIPVWIAIELIKKNTASNKMKYAHSELMKKTQYEIDELKQSIHHHAAIASSIKKLNSELPTSGVLIKIPLTRLYESRQGAAVTQTSGTLQAQTKTGTVGIGTRIGPVGVGLAASKGETRGTINSSSVTHAGKDEMQKIDEGDLILSVDSISFAGSQFSTSVPFENLLSCQISQNEILVSSKNSEKNWLIAVNSDSVASYLSQLIDLLADSSKVSKVVGSKLITSIASHNLGEIELFDSELEVKKQELLRLENTKP